MRVFEVIKRTDIIIIQDKGIFILNVNLRTHPATIIQEYSNCSRAKTNWI